MKIGSYSKPTEDIYALKKKFFFVLLSSFPTSKCSFFFPKDYNPQVYYFKVEKAVRCSTIKQQGSSYLCGIISASAYWKKGK